MKSLGQGAETLKGPVLGAFGVYSSVCHHEGHLRDCAIFQEEGRLPLEGSSWISSLDLGALISYNQYDIF